MGTDLLGRPTTEAEDELLELYRRCKALLERDAPAVADAAGVADERLDVALLVGPPDEAEVVLEQVVALQPEELVGDPESSAEKKAPLR